MRRLMSPKIERLFVDEAPTPRVRRIIRLHDWMAGLMEVSCCMLILRAVTAADVAASPADPQMHPLFAHLQALFTSVRRRRYNADFTDVCTRHVSSLIRSDKISITCV